MRAYADELGLGDQVTIESQPYEAMPAVFAEASAMVLASLPSAGGGMPPLLTPRVFWEEQFGLVLAEAMASGLDIVASDSGAIAEVLDGNGALVAPGDWPALAVSAARRRAGAPAGAARLVSRRAAATHTRRLPWPSDSPLHTTDSGAVAYERPDAAALPGDEHSDARAQGDGPARAGAAGAPARAACRPSGL